MSIQPWEASQTVFVLKVEIARREKTIAELKADGHRTTDAERELLNLKKTLALLR
jgi:hypothetical protein